MNILLIISTVLVVVLLWAAVGFRYLRHLRGEMIAAQDELFELLRKRQDLVPLMVEIVRQHEEGHDFGALIKARSKAMKVREIGADLVSHEHDLSKEINRAVALRKEVDGLRQDTIFQEVRSEIEALEKQTEEKVGEYNGKVRANNKGVAGVFTTFFARIFGFKKAKIFEFEI